MGVRAFISGFIAVMLSAAAVALYLFIAGREFYNTAKLVMYMNIPVAVIEGIATVFIVSFLLRVKPDILNIRKN